MSGMESSDGEEYTYQDESGEEVVGGVESQEEEEEYSYSDGEGGGAPVPLPPPSSSMADGCKVIDADELRATMSALIDDISSVLAIHPCAAAALLRHYNWNKESVIDSFCTDPDQAKEKAGIMRFVPDLQTSDKGRLCGICREDVPAEALVALGCGHFFCRGCFTQYLVSKVEEGMGCPLTRCPEYRCPEMVTENFFRVLVPPATLAAYLRYSLKSFVDICSAFRWCPGRGCDFVAMGNSSLRACLCKCGMLFCFRCGEEAHVPASCEDMVTWVEKCKNESETANWILANTRKCPKCATRIEKNQGCNHMTCRQCKFEFCWICMGPWTEHGANTGGYYKCNKYDPSTPTKDEQDGAKAKAELDRYLHYYQRYDNHHKAQEYATKQEEEIERRMMRLQETDGSRWIDVQFLKVANEKLVECRRVLKYTYVFGYYLPEGTARKRLFEHHQENLEKFTEHLSWLSEQSLEEFKKEEKRSEVVNYTRVTETFLKNLLKSVEDGLMDEDGEDMEEGGWEGKAEPGRRAGAAGGGQVGEAAEEGRPTLPSRDGAGGGGRARRSGVARA
ncbi:ariadne-like ubiquitin ligase [Nannochloropsis gaditana]|uniref:RBR-type E3 ubiquitin transferase n=1 Tax=Nannochloropsis gaditana TaxID=72520 RepID=W7T651_9STRA|nr:ariadne-like ubiquitin ligase [Nannochloropsis gaditana]